MGPADMIQSDDNIIVKSNRLLKCADVRELLSAYIDGDLTLRTRLKVSNHISECVECRLLLGDMQAIVDMAKGLGCMSIPCDVSTRLRQVLVKTGCMECVDKK